MKTRMTLAFATVLAATLVPMQLRAAPDGDERIVSAAKRSYVYRTYLARNQAEKDLVTKLASDIHGVKSVVNSMAIVKNMVFKE